MLITKRNFICKLNNRDLYSIEKTFLHGIFRNEFELTVEEVDNNNNN
jgi:hypothetical protein